MATVDEGIVNDGRFDSENPQEQLFTVSLPDSASTRLMLFKEIGASGCGWF